MAPGPGDRGRGTGAGVGMETSKGAVAWSCGVGVLAGVTERTRQRPGEALSGPGTQSPHLWDEFSVLPVIEQPAAFAHGNRAFGFQREYGRGQAVDVNEFHSPGTKPSPRLPILQLSHKPVRAAECQAPRVPRARPGQ